MLTSPIRRNSKRKLSLDYDKTPAVQPAGESTETNWIASQTGNPFSASSRHCC
jgi:hypothetical protein